MENMTIIGIDPPVSKNCGLAVVRLKDDKAELLEKFTKVLDNKDKDNGPSLEAVYDRVEQLISFYSAKIVCMERQLGGGFQFGRAKLNEYVGVIRLCCHRLGVKVVEVSPAHLKLIIAGHGKAPKEKIMANIAATFKLDDAGVEHECDAAAFALTYLIDNGWTGYDVKVPYTEEEREAEKASKAARKKKKEDREKAKAVAEAEQFEPKVKKGKKAKV